MQTFLPYPDFEATAWVLDKRRLGKQRVEALQILSALGRTSGGWVNHPAVNMWRGHEDALKLYALAMCRAWVERFGHGDTVAEQVLERCPGGRPPQSPEMPPWLGDPTFHRSHQSNLIRKAPDYYGPRFPGVPADLPYVWPAGRAGQVAPTRTPGSGRSARG